MRRGYTSQYALLTHEEHIMANTGIKVLGDCAAYVDDEGVCRLTNCKVEISHPVSLKEGKLEKVHKDLKYTLNLDEITLKSILEGWGADKRIALAAEFRKTSDEFVDSIKNKTFTLAGLAGEISLARTDMTDEDLEAQIRRLEAIVRLRKAKANPQSE
jgi:hypothetical protein